MADTFYNPLIMAEFGSSPTSPSSGYGKVYSKTDGKLYYKNSAGTEYELTKEVMNYTVNIYTASDTWTKPSDLNYAIGIIVGAGGGGGSGRIGASLSARAGGRSGGNGGIALFKVSAANLSTTETVTIGAGGAGGAARTGTSQSGLAGTAGGSTLFGNIEVSGGTSGGLGATNVATSSQTNTTTLTAPSTRYRNILGFYKSTNSPGSTEPVTTISDDYRGMVYTSALGGSLISAGGAGGALSTTDVLSNPTATAGYYNSVNTLTNETTGATPANPTSAETFGVWLNSLYSWFDYNDVTNLIGRGGAGGKVNTGAGTGTGGNGYGYGAGGGGGGAALNGSSGGSGAGGTGSGGLCIIINVLN